MKRSGFLLASALLAGGLPPAAAAGTAAGDPEAWHASRPEAPASVRTSRMVTPMGMPERSTMGLMRRVTSSATGPPTERPPAPTRVTSKRTRGPSPTRRPVTFTFRLPGICRPRISGRRLSVTSLGEPRVRPTSSMLRSLFRNPAMSSGRRLATPRLTVTTG